MFVHQVSTEANNVNFAVGIANTGFKTGQRSFFLCPKQGNKVVVVAFSRVCILEFFCPKPGHGFKPSATHPYSNIGPVPPPTPRPHPGDEVSPGILQNKLHVFIARFNLR